MPSITELKKQAKQINKQTQIGHLNALNKVAQSNGFNSWSLLLHKLAGVEPYRVEFIYDVSTIDLELNIKKYCKENFIKIDSLEFMRKLVKAIGDRTKLELYEAFDNCTLIITNIENLNNKTGTQFFLSDLIRKRKDHLTILTSTLTKEEILLSDNFIKEFKDVIFSSI